MNEKKELFCLKVENKHTGGIDFYFRNKLIDVVRLKCLIQLQFPKYLFSIKKVSSLPILDLTWFNENDIRALEL